MKDSLFEKVLERSIDRNAHILKALARPWMDTLFITKVGSHMWRMDTEKSDTDLFLAYRSPLGSILCGRKGKSYQDQREGVDIACHEIGHIIQQVEKNNVNFLWGIFSPIIVEDKFGQLEHFRHLVRMNLSKRVYNSINGLAHKNYNKYLTGDAHLGYSREVRQKKTNIIARTIRFGIGVLLDDGIRFESCNVKTEDLQPLMDQLAKARDDSPLCENPENMDLLWEWLIKLRLEGGDQYGV